jgi:hypothetical protein
MMRARALGTALLLLAACAGDTHAPRPVRIEAQVATAARPWTGLEPLESPDDFRFVVVTDRTGEHRAGVFESAMPKVNLLQPAFVMSVGDLIEGYTEDPAQLDREWDEFQSFVGRLQMPFFYVPGNHDMSNRVMADEWRARFGPTFYHFRYKNTLFIALNSELFGMVHEPETPLPGPETQAQQMEWLARVLAENRDVRWTLLFVHQPLWDKKKVPGDWRRVEQWLSGRPHTVFAGHFHRYTSHVRNGSNYITLATTGGGSLLRGLVFGEFDHVALVTMKRQGPVIANLLLDGIQDKDVRTTATREVAQRLERAIEAEPIAGSDPFRRGTARFRVTNAGPEPLELQAEIDGGRDLRASIERLARSVAPGASEEIAFEIESVGRTPLASLAPGKVNWRLRSAASDGTPVEMPARSLLLPEQRLGIPRLRRPVQVDGDLGEWGELPLAAAGEVQVDGEQNHSGGQDASFRFAVGWDEQNFYLAVDAVDDHVLLSPEKTWMEQDHLAFSIDARPDPERSANEASEGAISTANLRALLRPSAAPVEPRPDPISQAFRRSLPQAAQIASRRSARGYTAELAIPASALDGLAKQRWRELRINVSQLDLDPDEAGHSIVWFRPDRFGPVSIPGSGTFERR